MSVTWTMRRTQVLLVSRLRPTCHDGMLVPGHSTWLAALSRVCSSRLEGHERRKRILAITTRAASCCFHAAGGVNVGLALSDAKCLRVELLVRALKATIDARKFQEFMSQRRDAKESSWVSFVVGAILEEDRP